MNAAHLYLPRQDNGVGKKSDNPWKLYSWVAGQDIIAAQDSDLNPGAPTDLEKAASLTIPKCSIFEGFFCNCSLNPF